jgi:predicted acylesterase/phospholipase RssA
LKDRFPGKMGDAKLPWGVFVVDLDHRTARFLNSWDDPKIPSADALRATISVPFFFKAVRIGTLGRKLFVDGGLARNFGIGIYDDNPRRSIGVAFRTEDFSPVRVGTPLAITRAVAETLVNNINHTPVSGKHKDNIIEVVASGGSMDFTLSKTDVLNRYREGERAAEKWCDAQA